MRAAKTFSWFQFGGEREDHIAPNESVEPSIHAMLDWMEENEAKLGIPPLFRLFAQDNPDIILSQKTPRAFIEAGQLCSRYMALTNYMPKNAYDIPHDDAFLLELMASKIGESAAAQVQSYAVLKAVSGR